MPKVKSLIGDVGVTYSRHYCQTAVCCPARVTFLTGRMAHNTNVTDIVPPFGMSLLLFTFNYLDITDRKQAAGQSSSSKV